VVLALADRNLLTPLQGREGRYAKYYERNPLGPPHFFLARDAESDAFVGMAAIFPTRLRVFGELVPAAIAGDFAVDEGHRGLGPSLPLQRAAVGALGENGLSCAFGYPNEYSEPITKRIGYVDVGRLTRFVKVLRSRVVVDTYVRSRGVGRVAAGLSRVTVDPLLWLTSGERRHGRGHPFRVERPAAFDDRFAELWEATWRQRIITSERNAELLNWKYETANGGGVYTIFALVGPEERVVAYAVHRVRNGIRHLVDIVFQPSREVVDALFAELVTDARREGAAAITLLHLGAAGLLTERLRAFGFVRRTDESGLRIYVPGSSQLHEDLLEARNWYFLTGDADV
jgi:hypothetical protein